MVIDRFPGLLSDVLKVAADDREYDLMLLSSLTVLSTVMPGVDVYKRQFVIFQNMVVHLHFAHHVCYHADTILQFVESRQEQIFDDLQLSLIHI